VAPERLKLGTANSFEQGFHARRSLLSVASKGHDTSRDGLPGEQEDARKD
jgi:hypothetical protein